MDHQEFGKRLSKIQRANKNPSFVFTKHSAPFQNTTNHPTEAPLVKDRQYIARPKNTPPPPPAQDSKIHVPKVNVQGHFNVSKTSSQLTRCLEYHPLVSKDLLLPEYRDDVFHYLRILETKFVIHPDFMAKQTELSQGKRATLLDWLNLLHTELSLTPETFYITVSLIDRYLQVHDVPRQKFQLLGVTAMYVASKYEEIVFPEVENFAYATDYSSSKWDIFRMERILLRTLNFQLGRPLPITFLRHLSSVEQVGKVPHHLSAYFLELAVQTASLAHLAPSLLAAAVTYLSFYVTSRTWSPSTALNSGYTKLELYPVAKEIASVAAQADTSKLQAVRTKFSAKFSKIALFPELKRILQKF